MQPRVLLVAALLVLLASARKQPVGTGLGTAVCLRTRKGSLRDPRPDRWLGRTQEPPRADPPTQLCSLHRSFGG